MIELDDDYILQKNLHKTIQMTKIASQLIHRNMNCYFIIEILYEVKIWYKW